MQEEFARQASAMVSAPAFRQEQTLRHIYDSVRAMPAGRVLEVACGPGLVAEAIASLVTELVCIDATPEMLELARARLQKAGHTNVTFYATFAESLPFEDDAFDLVVTRLSFHHFKDIQCVLSEIYRVLRPQGRLVVADIISSADEEESRLHNALERLRDPSHICMFSKGQLLSALRVGGFNPLSSVIWEQRRSFREWAAIVSMPGRAEPLLEVMRVLSRAGLQAGVHLQESGQEVTFTHTWMLVTAALVC
jgi:ubiquinone/menaquinone biosynthesis C-methylase UbiE